ncbi:MAG: PQQ-like beta-propeller repeat protein [Opitutaceae bacterium]|nr:PQQ-like beta-propeller repeat protein [Opitutaceae bacterium]
MLQAVAWLPAANQASGEIGISASRPAHSAGLALALGVALLLAGGARADDWPQWRGPGRDGVWRETGIIESFSGAELKPVWTAPVGPGYTGPTVAGDRVFLTDRVTAPEPQERVLCFDRATGAPRWTHAYPCVYRDIDYALGPRAAVTVADGRAFALGAMGHAHCLDVADGKVLWARDLPADFHASINVWAVTAAPLVVGNLVIFQIGGEPDACLVALEVATGKERWRALGGRASYSSPRLVRLDGRDVVLAWTASWIACLEPATGRVLWQEPYKPKNMILNVPDPVLDETGRNLFLTAFYDGSHLYALKPGFGQPELRWRRTGQSERKTDGLHSTIMTPLIRDGHAYGIDSYGQMRCLDLATGDRVWEDTSLLANGRWATAHFVQHGEHTWITTEKGEIVIARLSPRGFERMSSARFITPETKLRGRDHPIAWSHPAYAHRSLFARNDSQLVCISLAAER